MTAAGSTPHSIGAILWVIWFLGWMAAAGFSARTVARQGVAARMRHTLPIWLGAILLFGNGLGWPGLERTLFASPPLPAWLGVALIATGLAFTVWARVVLGRFWSATVTLKADHALVRRGPYAITRHPIYTGLLLALLGTVLLQNSVAGLVGCALIALGFVLKSRQEEAWLRAHFGATYDVYRAEVPALIPRMRR